MLTSLQALLRLATLRWLGVFVCALATLLAATTTASALEPAQTKTRVWGFDFAEHNSSGLFRAASSGKHQENRLAVAEAASGSLLAARAGGEALKLGRFKMTQTVANHAADIVKKGPFKGELARPYLNSPHTVEQILQAGKGVADPGGVAGALRWDVAGTFRGSQGTWELVMKGDTILHFNFITP